MSFLPHGVCWNWNPWLILLHSGSDYATWGAYLAVPLIATKIYRRGRFRRLRLAYPKLWFWGGMFVLLCGLNHFGSGTETWLGGWFYWLTGANKVAMAGASWRFVVLFNRRSEDIAMAGRVLEAVEAEAEHRQ